MFGFGRKNKEEKQETIEKLITDFNDKNSQKLDPVIRALDISSECGLFCKEVLSCQPFDEKNTQLSDGIKKGVGNLLYSVISFANENNIELLALVKNTLENFENKNNK